MDKEGKGREEGNGGEGDWCAASSAPRSAIILYLLYFYVIYCITLAYIILY